MIIGRLTAQAGKSRFQFNSEYQHRCEGTPLTVDTPGLPQPRRGLDRPRQQRGAAQMSPEATSTAGRGYFDVPFYVNQGILDDAGDQQAAVRRRLHGVPLPADLRLPAAGRHHEPDSGDRAVQRDQPGDGHCPSRRWRTTGTARVEQWGPAIGKTDDCSASMSYVTGAHSVKVGYQGHRLDLLDDADRPDAAWSTGSTRASRTPSATTCRTWAAGRSRTEHRRLRAGQLDARPPDAAGCPALRSRVELRARRRQRHVRQVVVPEPAPITFPETQRAWTPTTTSRRAWASRTTCSATARRR